VTGNMASEFSPPRNKFLKTFFNPRFLFLAFLVFGVASWMGIVWDLPSADQIRNYVPKSSVKIQAVDGSTIYNGGAGPTRRVSYQEIPKELRQAIVATEDRRFFEHNGVDFLGIGRALVRDVQSGGLKEGGSTITQQLARNLFLTQERTLWRKLKEAAIAARIEQDFSKEEILTLYLNQVYLGSGAYGITDAALLYFNKPVQQLTLIESAVLAGLPQAPSRYSPLVSKELARKRRDVVLKNMVEAGLLKQSAYAKAQAKPLKINPRPQLLKNQAAYFTSYIQSLLPEVLGTNVQGGLTVETTLDPLVQAQAQSALSRALARNRGRSISQGAIVSLDPLTGEIRALVGGEDFQTSQFNRAVQALRQPGSAFKVFVYTHALETGIDPGAVYVDEPIRFGPYEVKNYDRDYQGPMTLVKALRESRNTIAVKLLEQVGERETIETAQRMGINSPLQANPTLALGSSETTLLELTSAYGTLANGGLHTSPSAIRRILNQSGQVLYESKLQQNQAVSPEVAWSMTKMLEQVVKAGTGRKADIGRPVAGKTGTSENNRDLLFVGYIPQLVTGIWLGNDDSSPTRGTSSMAAGVWGEMMGKVTSKMPIVAFAEPNNLATDLRDRVLAAAEGRQLAPAAPPADMTGAPPQNEPTESIPPPENPSATAPPQETGPTENTPQSAPLDPSNPQCFDPNAAYKEGSGCASGDGFDAYRDQRNRKR
jgi:penicillin-binding protein 1A